MNFGWDPRKAEINLRKHNVSFTEADRGNRIRIISARELTPSERKAYEKEND